MQNHKFINKSWKTRFLTMSIGQAISMVGSSAVQFSLIWWITSVSNSAIVLSIAGLFAFLPQALLGPFAGVWIDRLPRKQLLIITDLAMGTVAAMLAIIFYLWQTPPYWMAYAVLALRSFGNVLYTPAVQATIPLLAPKNELVRVNSINELLQTSSTLLGPILGAAMYAVLPMYIILLTDLLGAIIASSAVGVIIIPKIKLIKSTANFVKELRGGLYFFFRDNKLLFYTIALFVCMIFYMPIGILFPLMVKKVFGGGQWFAGLTQSLFTVGLLIAAALLGVIGPKIKQKLMISQVGMFVLALSLILAGLMPHNRIGLYLFISFCFFNGVGSNMSNIAYVSYLQETIPKEFHGRVLSIFNTLSSVAMPIGLVLAGPGSDSLGLPKWFIIAGIGIIGSILLNTLLVKYKRRKINNVCKNRNEYHQ